MMKRKSQGATVVALGAAIALGACYAPVKRSGNVAYDKPRPAPGVSYKTSTSRTAGAAVARAPASAGPAGDREGLIAAAPVVPVTKAATTTAATAEPGWRDSTPVKAIPVRAAAGADLPTYEVRRGDTVYGISRRFEVPIESLIGFNDLTPPYVLGIGQKLSLPVEREHVVARGETVYGIARTYGVGFRDLASLNGIGSSYAISPGQRLTVPAPVAPVLADTLPAGKQLANLPPASPGPKTIPEPPARAGSKFAWPVRGPVVLGFGPKKSGLHNDGINIKAPRGAPIKAADNGVVAYAGNELRGFGNLILLKHADGWVTAYAHTEKVLVRRGDTVRRGQTIGRVGSSGNVSQPQLHFEVRRGTRAVDPTRLLAAQTAGG